VEDPSRLTKNLAQLNLQFIKDPAEIEREQSKMGASQTNLANPTMAGKVSPRRASNAISEPKNLKGESEQEVT